MPQYGLRYPTKDEKADWKAAVPRLVAMIRESLKRKLNNPPKYVITITALDKVTRMLGRCLGTYENAFDRHLCEQMIKAIGDKVEAIELVLRIEP